jgi:hypothetical protein
MRHLKTHWTGWAALIVGLGALKASLTVSSTETGRGLLLASSAFIVFFSALSLLARHRTPSCWGLVVIGLVTVMPPWLGGGFTPDPGAGWTATIAGALAMTLGAIGWVTGRPPTVTGINRYGGRDVTRSRVASWLSGGGLAIGLAAVLLGATVVRSTAGVAVTVGLGAFLALIALWSLLAPDPTHDYFTFAIIGFALFLAPTAAEFSAWQAVIPGALATLLSTVGYLRGESLDVAGRLTDAVPRGLPFTRNTRLTAAARWFICSDPLAHERREGVTHLPGKGCPARTGRALLRHVLPTVGVDGQAAEVHGVLLRPLLLGRPDQL